jgi:hypothetical protein
MADPLSIVAIIGLALAGRTISQKLARPASAPPPLAPSPPAKKIDELPQNQHFRRETFVNENKDITNNFADIVPNFNVNGSPVNDFRNRPFISSKMNNIGPASQEMVGPGLGVGPNVPAYGGYQQLYQVRPENVGAYRLTTLPGRSGPAADISGGKRGVIGELTQQNPEKTAFLPSRRPNVPGKLQGATGVVVRGEYEKTKRTTNRSETTVRSDGLSFAPAKRFISAQQLEENPTRNKGDVNTSAHYQQMAPSVSSFAAGYTNTAIVKMMNSPGGSKEGYTNGQLAQTGIRVTDNREHASRSGNAGRMNVLVNNPGKLTAVRMDTNKYNGRVNPANGSQSQQYNNIGKSNFNAYKENTNSRAGNASLNVARKQLAGNPFNHSLSS